MSDGNGTPKDSPILSLDRARRPLGKSGDYITRQQCSELIVAECSKVHEHYLVQIPNFVARMIQDALMSYGLIAAPTPAPETASIEAQGPAGVHLAGDGTSVELDGGVPVAPMEVTAS